MPDPSPPPAAAPAVAIIGASSDRRKYGNKAVRAHLHAGYTVYPVHPTETVVEGQPAYRTLADVPAARLDRVTVYLPPPATLKLLDSLTAKPSGELVSTPARIRLRWCNAPANSA